MFVGDLLKICDFLRIRHVPSPIGAIVVVIVWQFHLQLHVKKEIGKVSRCHQLNGLFTTNKKYYNIWYHTQEIKNQNNFSTIFSM
jgi:hypothetical protein